MEFWVPWLQLAVVVGMLVFLNVCFPLPDRLGILRFQLHLTASTLNDRLYKWSTSTEVAIRQTRWDFLNILLYGWIFALNLQQVAISRPDMLNVWEGLLWLNRVALLCEVSQNLIMFHFLKEKKASGWQAPVMGATTLVVLTNYGLQVLVLFGNAFNWHGL